MRSAASSGWTTPSSPDRHRRRVAAALTAAVLVGALASCSAPAEGPLRFATEPSFVCMPILHFRHIAFGIPIPDDLDATIVVVGVEPLGVDGLHAESLHLMPVEPHWRLLADHFPPEDNFPEQWADAVPAVGAEVRPGETVDLVVQVEPDADGGSFEELRLSYSAFGRDYTADYPVGLEVVTGACD